MDDEFCSCLIGLGTWSTATSQNEKRKKKISKSQNYVPLAEANQQICERCGRCVEEKLGGSESETKFQEMSLEETATTISTSDSLSVAEEEDDGEEELYKSIRDNLSTVKLHIKVMGFTFVNREEQALELIMHFGSSIPSNTGVTATINSTELTLAAIGQPYGIGKSTFISNLWNIAGKANLWEKATQLAPTSSKERLANLKKALLWVIDFREMCLTSPEWSSQLTAFFLSRWMKVLSSWIERGLLGESDLKAIELANLKLKVCNNPGDFFKTLGTLNIPMVIHLDELEALHHLPERDVPGRPTGIGTIADYERIQTLWNYLIPALKEKSLFMVVTCKNPYFLSLAKSLFPRPPQSLQSSPTMVQPIYMTALGPDHVKQIFTDTWIEEKALHRKVNLLDCMKALGLTSELEPFFWKQMELFSAGIPRIVRNTTMGLLDSTFIADLSTESGIVEAFTRCAQYQKESDFHYFKVGEKPTYRALIDKLILLGSLGIALPMKQSILVDGVPYSLLYLLQLLPLLYEILPNETVLIKAPYYALLNSDLAAKNYTITLSRLLRDKPEQLDKGMVFQEVVLQNTALKMISNSGKAFAKAFPVYKECFFADYRISVSSLNQCIKMYPGFIQPHHAYQSKKKETITKTDFQKIASHPYHYELYRTHQAFQSLLNHAILAENKFGRPTVTNSVGEDALFVLKHIESKKITELIAFQYKLHSSNDVTWSTIQEDIDKIALVCPHSATWSYKICVHMIVIGLGIQVKELLANGPVVIKEGYYTYAEGNLSETTKTSATLTIPKGIELLLMPENEIALFVGEKNLVDLHKYNSSTTGQNWVTNFQELLIPLPVEDDTYVDFTEAEKFISSSEVLSGSNMHTFKVTIISTTLSDVSDCKLVLHAPELMLMCRMKSHQKQASKMEMEFAFNAGVLALMDLQGPTELYFVMNIGERKHTSAKVLHTF